MRVNLNIHKMAVTAPKRAISAPATYNTSKVLEYDTVAFSGNEKGNKELNLIPVNTSPKDVEEIQSIGFDGDDDDEEEYLFLHASKKAEEEPEEEPGEEQEKALYQKAYNEGYGEGYNKGYKKGGEDDSIVDFIIRIALVTVLFAKLSNIKSDISDVERYTKDNGKDIKAVGEQLEDVDGSLEDIQEQVNKFIEYELKKERLRTEIESLPENSDEREILERELEILIEDYANQLLDY